MQIEDRQVEGPFSGLLELLQRLLPCSGAGVTHRPAGELVREDLPVGGVVIDDQHAQPVEAFGDVHHQTCIGVLLAQRDLEPEQRTLAGLAAHADAPAHHLDQPLGDDQPEAGAAKAPGGRTVGLDKGAEQPGLCVLADADAAILDFEAETRLLRSLVEQPDADEDIAAAGEFDGVVHQVGQDLAHAHRVADDGHREVVRHAADHFEPLRFGRLGEQAAEVLDQLPEVEVDAFDIDLAGLDLRKVENVVDDRQEMLAGLVDGVGETLLLRVQRRLAQQLGHAQDAVHRRADLVAHGRQKLALRPAAGFGEVLRLVQVGGAPGHLGFQQVALGGQFAGRRLQRSERQYLHDGIHRDAQQQGEDPAAQGFPDQSAQRADDDDLADGDTRVVEGILAPDLWRGRDVASLRNKRTVLPENLHDLIGQRHWFTGDQSLHAILGKHPRIRVTGDQAAQCRRLDPGLEVKRSGQVAMGSEPVAEGNAQHRQERQQQRDTLNRAFKMAVAFVFGPGHGMMCPFCSRILRPCGECTNPRNFWVVGVGSFGNTK